MPNCACAGRGILSTSMASTSPAATLRLRLVVSFACSFVHAPRIMLASSVRGKDIEDGLMKIVRPLRVAFHVRGLMRQLSGLLPQLCGQQLVLVRKCLKRCRIRAGAHVAWCPFGRAA